MEQAIKVSVIIPVFNTAPWLKDCLDSVIQQDYLNLQIICINDGSTDDSLSILNSYAEKDARIQIIDQENHGQGNARNRALDISTGKYIMFVDSDDMLFDGIIKKMVDHAEENGMDMLRCSGETIFESEIFEKRFRNFQYTHAYPDIYSGLDLYHEMKQNKEYTSSVYRALYLRSWLEKHQIRFLELVHEDELWSYKCYLYSERCGLVPEKGYIRRYRDDSIMTKPISLNNIRAYYITACHMTLLCYENREKLERYPEFVDYPFRLLKDSSKKYKDNFDNFNTQIRDNFDRMMLKELDQFIAADDAAAALQKERDKRNAEAAGHQAELAALRQEMDRRESEYQKTLTGQEKSARKKLKKKDREIKKTKQKLASVYRSASWKAGRVITYIPRKIKGFMKKKKQS